MRRKTSAVVLIVLLCLCCALFCACGDTSTSSQGGKGNGNGNGSNNSQEQVANIWEIRHYTNEFNQTTDQLFMVNKSTSYFEGTFSNGVVTNENAVAFIIIDEYDIHIQLWEYGSNLVKAYSDTVYFISVSDDNGSVTSITGDMLTNRNRITLRGDKLISLLKNNKSLSISIKEKANYYSSTYLFNIKTGNFNSVYNELLSKF